MLDPHAAAFMLGCVARLVMAVIFAHAALHAMRDWPVYAAVVGQYRLAPGPVSRVAAWVLPPLQLVSAVLLLVWSIPGALLGLVLMCLFTAAIAVNLRRGRMDIDCGCGGADGQHLSTGLVWRNLMLMLLLAGSALAPVTGQADPAMLIGTAGSLVFLVGLYFIANQLLTNQQRLRGGVA